MDIKVIDYLDKKVIRFYADFENHNTSFVKGMCVIIGAEVYEIEMVVYNFDTHILELYVSNY